jgi:hypothetical protein
VKSIRFASSSEFLLLCPVKVLWKMNGKRQSKPCHQCSWYPSTVSLFCDFNIFVQNSFVEQPQTILGENEEIDSALLNALNNPRERMILFQIEDMIAKFVHSK